MRGAGSMSFRPSLVVTSLLTGCPLRLAILSRNSSAYMVISALPGPFSPDTALTGNDSSLAMAAPSMGLPAASSTVIKMINCPPDPVPPLFSPSPRTRNSVILKSTCGAGVLVGAGAGVGCAGTGVAVGGSGVGVSVGAGVSVGGGGVGVLVAAGVGLAVGVAVGRGVAVGGRGVAVGVHVGRTATGSGVGVGFSAPPQALSEVTIRMGRIIRRITLRIVVF